MRALLCSSSFFLFFFIILFELTKQCHMPYVTCQCHLPIPRFICHISMSHANTTWHMSHANVTYQFHTPYVACQCHLPIPCSICHMPIKHAICHMPMSHTKVTCHIQIFSVDRIVQLFSQFLNTSESLLSNYGLRSDDLSNMYTNIKRCIVNEQHVSFPSDSGSSVEPTDTDKFKTLTQLSVLSANDSSLDIAGTYSKYICAMLLV